MNLDYFVANLEKLNSPYWIGAPASSEKIAETEKRLNISFPVQVEIFYRKFNGLEVENPAFKILSLEQLNFLSPDLLHFSTFDNQYKVCFDTSHLNSAEQWFIVFADGGNRITFTMASFWSNKIWHWLIAKRCVWLD